MHYLDKFMSDVSPEPMSGCWLWDGACHSSSGGMDYGRARHAIGRLDRAHRAAWILMRGPIPAGLCVCHRCDNPACVNPDHLFLGTNADNVRDMMRKGRGRKARGESAGRAKLKTSDVVIIREVYRSAGVKQSSLAAMFGVTQAVVSKIVRGQLWPHAHGGV